MMSDALMQFVRFLNSYFSFSLPRFSLIKIQIGMGLGEAQVPPRCQAAPGRFPGAYHSFMGPRFSDVTGWQDAAGRGLRAAWETHRMRPGVAKEAGRQLATSQVATGRILTHFPLHLHNSLC